MKRDEFTDTLKEAAWQVVKENPGIDCAEWISTLIRQFPTEVVDALGTDPYDVHHILTDWWDSEDYTDPDGINETYQGFSEYYYNDLDYLHEQIDKAERRIYELSQELRHRDNEILGLQTVIKEMKNPPN